MAEQTVIVVPIDWSEQSLIALEQAANVAETLSSSLHLIYVKDGPGVFSSAATKTYQEELEKEVLEKLKETGYSLTKERGISITYEVRAGKIYEQINQVAEDKEALFIIMGTSGGSGLKGRFIGSNALRVVKQSSVPVITIKGKHHTKGCKTIVLPLDLTKETREKVGKAIEFAQSFQSKIVIVSVLETKDDYQLNHLRRQMVQVHRYAEDHGVEVTSDMIEKNGTVANTIIGFANKVNGDLLMIMTQQESDFTDLFIGSQAQEIIHKSDVPVLSIIPKPSEATFGSIFN
jgi:nucleotide-binding universal stress UspA family protein